MRIARVGAFIFTAVCLGIAAVSLLLPAKQTICVGGECSTVSCGSPAFPKSLIDFGSDQIEDATNCAGGTPASMGLYGVVLAGVGLGAIVATSMRGTIRPERSSMSEARA